MRPHTIPNSPFPRSFNESTHASSDPDAPTRATDGDASLARLSAVRKGYLNDDFAALFVPRAHLQPNRAPLINIGTWVRTIAIDRLVDQWLLRCEDQGVQAQIVSLGAGSDSRFWKLMAGSHASTLAKYVEVDFSEITGKKAMTIRKDRTLNGYLGPDTSPQLDNLSAGGGTGISSSVYNLVPADIRCPPDEALSALFTPDTPILSKTVPTLLLFECVLAYMPPSDSEALLAWFAAQFTDSAPLGAVVYEMFGLEDSFGKMMISNLKSRGVSLPGVVPYKDQASLPNRFTKTGFSRSQAWTLKDIRKEYIEAEEHERVSTLELVDEIEEIDLVLSHYAITSGILVPQGLERWFAWDLPKLQQGQV
ncbi:leucine carboxyl methyltransferase [Cylindrobasidium torrendii FP15055 ss-10]|uniref:Leucine carboxyl methyltransferase 1 n=1 Tax=Cylindrobasidium torrendii FP15055 ss-10 TaxID=1314674 RepID=A0A0D7BSI9_9AGAR|nr:leucine carboxyl methyltransferase [Cylindrobasidium torrendii FP15055 ss-10]